MRSHETPLVLARPRVFHSRSRHHLACVSRSIACPSLLHCVMHQQISHNLAQCQASQLRDVTVTVAILQFSFSVDQTDASSRVGAHRSSGPAPVYVSTRERERAPLCRRFLCGRFCSPLCSDLGDRCLHQSESSSESLRHSSSESSSSPALRLRDVFELVPGSCSPRSTSVKRLCDLYVCG